MGLARPFLHCDRKRVANVVFASGEIPKNLKYNHKGHPVVKNENRSGYLSPLESTSRTSFHSGKIRGTKNTEQA